MFSKYILTALVASLFARADPVPSEPAPGEVFTEGGTCHIGWDKDTTGVWTEMTITLKTGDNFNMVALTTVATVDATTTDTYDYTCPEVTPNAAIYFYEFGSPASTNVSWTGRWTIAAADGTTTEPTNSTQPDGSAIPWGTGQLVDSSSATLASSSVSTTVSVTGALASVSSSASSVATTAAASTTVVTSTKASTKSASSTALSSGVANQVVSASTSGSTAAASDSAAASAAAAGLSIDGHLFRAAIALGVAALTFAVAV